MAKREVRELSVVFAISPLLLRVSLSSDMNEAASSNENFLAMMSLRMGLV